MKKKYIKPAILFESYELNTSIATCYWDLNVNNTSKDTCAASTDDVGVNTGVLLFNNGNGNCTVSPDKYDDFCYEHGGNGSNLFNS